MQTISEIINSYKDSIDYLDIEILLANSLNKTREFILTYPEYKVTSHQSSIIVKSIKRRIKGEPIAYIIGHKEFYGLDFIVNKYTLVPRPETEMMVEQALSSVISYQSSKKLSIIDVGTGSGCIITSIACNMKHIACNIENGIHHMCHPELVSGSSDINQDPREILKQVQDDSIKYYATDISAEALRVAKKNASKNDVKIKFLHGNLLNPFIQDTGYKMQDTNLIITANLPYLSKEIYNSAPIDVKKYEPKSALYSAKQGLAHYEELLNQIKNLSVISHQSLVISFFEISPEQKNSIKELIKSIFPKAKIEFKKDLTGKWRMVKIEIF